MKYLLLGGSGFIGRHLANTLARQHEVTIVGHSATKLDLKNIDYLHFDFIHCQDFRHYIENVDVIIHLISTIIPSDNLTHVNQEIEDNVFPTTTLLKNAAQLKKKIIFISSGGTVYGEHDGAITEDAPTNPICNYGISKLIIEKYLKLYHHFYGLEYKIIRPSNPYSEEICHHKKQGIVPIIVDDILRGNTITIWGKEKNISRDYIYIDDLINGIVAVLNYNGDKNIFNIGSGTSYTINDIIKMTEDKLNKKAKIKYLPARKCDARKNLLDINLIKQETGWAPKTPLTKGIDIIIKSKNKQGVSR